MTLNVPGPAGARERLDLGKLMDLIDAAEKAELKLRVEYQKNHPGDLAHPLESWAEGEALRHALDDLRFNILLNRLDVTE